MKLLSFVIIFALQGFAQAPAAPMQAQSSGTCSPNVMDNSGRVQFTCNVGIDKKTANKITVLLNRVLEKQVDASETNKKLDDILAFLETRLNPNRTVTTYNCAGVRALQGPSASAMVDIRSDNEKVADFQKMFDLGKSGQYGELKKYCSSQIESDPDWLTPYLFCGVASFELGDKDEARRLLAHYEQRTGKAYDDVDPCRTLSKQLREQLN